MSSDLDTIQSLDDVHKEQIFQLNNEIIKLKQQIKLFEQFKEATRANLDNFEDRLTEHHEAAQLKEKKWEEKFKRLEDTTVAQKDYNHEMDERLTNVERFAAMVDTDLTKVQEQSNLTTEQVNLLQTETEQLRKDVDEIDASKASGGGATPRRPSALFTPLRKSHFTPRITPWKSTKKSSALSQAVQNASGGDNSLDALSPTLFGTFNESSSDDSEDDDSSVANTIKTEDECNLVELNWDEVVTRRWYLLFQETFSFLNTTWPLTIEELKEQKTFYNFLRNQLNCRLTAQQAQDVDLYIEEIAKKMQAFFSEVPDTEDEFIESTIRLLCDIDCLKFY